MAQISFENKHWSTIVKPNLSILVWILVIYFVRFCDENVNIEQSQSQLGYLGRNNNISTDKEVSGKRVIQTGFFQKLCIISSDS